jgi:hypothetical protein
MRCFQSKSEHIGRGKKTTETVLIAKRRWAFSQALCGNAEKQAQTSNKQGGGPESIHHLVTFYKKIDRAEALLIQTIGSMRCCVTFHN